jgi:disulfide bond formation protein DsbB
MSVDTASLFFALLALACLSAVGALVVGWVVWLVGRSDSLLSFRADLGRVAVPVAWIVAAVATFGSLYYSEVADFVPCKLCWYQRICMYPLVVVLGVAALRRDRDVRWYAGPLAAIGASVAAYHTWLQAYPPSGGSSFCTLDAPCTERYVWEFGFVSLPLMALSGFLFVVAMMVLARPTRAGSSSEPVAGHEQDAPLERDRADGTDDTTRRAELVKEQT